MHFNKKSITLIFVCQLSLIFSFSQDLIPFSKKKNYEFLHASKGGHEFYVDANLLWGYKDSAGKTIIKAKYHKVREFNNGRAIVMFYDEFGIIDKKGKWILKPVYNEIGDFSEGLANVISKEGCGYVDKHGEIKIDLIYDYAEPFKNGLACVWKGVRKNYINKSGKLVLSDWKKYDFIDDFNEGYAPVLSWKSYGFIDSLGNEAIPLKFQMAHSFSHGLALVKVNGKFGFIDKTGEFVIDAQFDTATSFNNHISIVKKDKKFGVIKSNGKYLHDCEFDSVYPFFDGIALIEQNNLKGYINDKGIILVKPMFQLANPYRYGYAKVKQNNRYFFLDINGKNAFAKVFEDAASFFEGGATVMQNGKYYSLNTLGKLHNLSDTNRCLNIDELPYCRKKKKYTSEIQSLSYEGEFLGELIDRVADIYWSDFSEFRIEVILNEDGYWIDYKIINDIDGKLQKNAKNILNRLSEYSEPAIKDGKRVPCMFDFSIVWECEENNSGANSCSIYSIINLITEVSLEKEDNTE